MTEKMDWESKMIWLNEGTTKVPFKPRLFWKGKSWTIDLLLA